MADADYKTALFNEARNLSEVARESAAETALERDAEMAALLAAMEGPRPVLVVGPAGVGKTGLILAFARTWDKPIRELSCTSFLAGTRYLGEWQTKTQQICLRALETGSVLYITDVWNLPNTGKTSQSETNLWDTLQPYLQRGLKMLAEATPETLRLMERAPSFAAAFQKVILDPLAPAAVDRVLQHKTPPSWGPAVRSALVQLTTRFLPARPQPGPALELARLVEDAADGEPVTPARVERVFAESTGLPPFVVSREHTLAARQIRSWFEERIVGQEEAIEAVVEAIALFKAGLHDPGRPIATFLFVGPTGVGKTELARALATFLFGSPSRLLRFDLSEFKDYHSFEILVGSPKEAGRPAALVDPVRAQPFQVILLDELEKAHPNIWDLLLSVLDEGRLTPPGGNAVDFRSTILIATSNVGALESGRKVGFAPADDRERSIAKALEGHFRPEFLNRFQHLVVFHGLSGEQVRKVARQELKRILGREGITARNLAVEVDDDALDLVIRRGVDERYGARALKREIQRQIVLPIAMTLMEREVHPGSILKVQAREGYLEVRVVETAESRAAAAPRPVEPERPKLSAAELKEALLKDEARIFALSQALQEKALRQERGRILDLRAQPDFWRDAAAAAKDLRDLDRLTTTLDRLDRLRSRCASLLEELRGVARDRLPALGEERLALEEAVERAWRELLTMGSDGSWDALVEIRPLTGRAMRDRLAEVYRAWAEDRGMTVDVLFEPLADEEPVLLAVQGPYANGWLRGEAGLHRQRLVDESWSVARVRVAPWTDAKGVLHFGAHRALKTQGQLGGKVRSRLEAAGLVLQNARSIGENRELALEVGPSWSLAPAPVDEVVRRYEVDPPKVRDALTGWTSGKPDALEPHNLQELLTLRVDTLGKG